MNRWISALAMLLSALLCASSAQFAFAANTTAANAPADSEQIAQLLDQLGVRALLEQTPAVFAAAVEAETQWLAAKPQPANWRRELEAQLKPQLLLQDVTRYLRERYRADTFLQAQQRLAEPIAKRARYFDLAMTQPGAEKNLSVFLQQNGFQQNGRASSQTGASEAAAAGGTDARRALLGEIDAATSASLLTATLQSAIAARVQQAAGGGAVDPALLKDAIAERQRYLEPLAVDYLLYDYRYLRDDELLAYRDLLRDEAVQWLLEVSRQAVLTAVAGELTPPPVQPQ